MSQDATTTRSRRADCAIAAVLGLGLALLARAMFQERMLVDGAGLATFFGRGDRLAYHFLFLPACRVVAPLASLVAPNDPIEATRILSAVSYGVGGAFTWLFCREVLWRSARVAEVGPALVATLLLVASPAAFFFGTTVEVHALNFAVVAVSSWAIVRLPWRRPGVATACAALFTGLIFWGHQLGVLFGPGLVLLCGQLARWAGRPLSMRALLLGVGPALLLGMIAGSGLANWIETGSLLPSAEHELEILATFSRPPEAWWFAWRGWLKPMAFVIPLAVVGLVAGPIERGLRVTLAVLVGVPTAFLFTWGVAEYGGYVLAQAPFLAALVAVAIPHLRIGAAAAAGLVLFQLAIAYTVVVPRGRGYGVDERVALVAEHLQGGTFLATSPNAPSIRLWLPDAHEIVTDDALSLALNAEAGTAETVQVLLAAARAELARTGRLVVDLGYEGQRTRPGIPGRLVVLEPLAAALQREFTTTRIEHPDWPLLIVEP